MKKLKRIIAISMLLVMTAGLAGCDQDAGLKEQISKVSGDKTAAIDKTAADVETEEEVIKSGKPTVKRKVYYPDAEATKLIPVTITIPKDSNQYETVLKRMINGTPDKGEIKIIPAGTKVLKVEVENKTAYVDFSKEFTKKFNGGSDGEIMLVGSIVNTLTEFSEVQSVQIMVEGKKIDTISGHLDTAEPFKRFKDLIKN